jgi:hypothetical protein
MNIGDSYRFKPNNLSYIDNGTYNKDYTYTITYCRNGLYYVEILCIETNKTHTPGSDYFKGMFELITNNTIKNIDFIEIAKDICNV